MPELDATAAAVALKARLSAILGYAQACEQTLLADLPAAERDAPGSPERWSAHALLAHNADFRREQVLRLRAVAASADPPDFPQVDHRDPAVYARCAARPGEAVQAELATVVPDLVAALDAVGDDQLGDPSLFPWTGGRQLWAQVLVRGVWHPIGHLADYLVDHGRPEQSFAAIDGVVRVARALRLPARPGGVALGVYVSAAVRARAGEREPALGLLRAALADDPALAEKAARDGDFDELRRSPGFPA
jgi:hypothetical protein